MIHIGKNIVEMYLLFLVVVAVVEDETSHIRVEQCGKDMIV